MYFNINKIDTNDINFYNNLNYFLKNNLYSKINEDYVNNIIYNIKNFKDKSLIYYINKHDNLNVKNIKEIELNKLELENSFYKLNKNLRFILEFIFNRIIYYHENQYHTFYSNWKLIESDGTVLGQKINYIEKLAFYIPGGKAVYPSSIFMNTAVNKLFNIKNSVIAMPLNKLNKNYNLMLASLYLSNINKIFLMGGAHAIAALSYGTNIVSKVDKIYGPGNIYVSLAKKLVYGDVGIDIIAGPSEVVILFDKEWYFLDIFILDLFAQCEHDGFAQSIILVSDYFVLYKLEVLLNDLLPYMYKKSIIKESLKRRSFIIKTNNLKESCNIVNYMAPEHLIIFSENYKEIFKCIKNSGSIFLGNYCSESFGDYSLGVNHVLPTYQNSKFSSPLGSYDYIKRMNFSNLNYLGFNKLNDITSNFAVKENLLAHSESILLRKFIIYENLWNF